jgi:hypothetical protein
MQDQTRLDENIFKNKQEIRSKVGWLKVAENDLDELKMMRWRQRQII